MIHYNRKSVGLGLLIATIDSKMQQSIVIGSGTQSLCNWFSHFYHAVEYIYYIHASIDFTATFQFLLQLYKNQKYTSSVFKIIPYVNILEVLFSQTILISK